MYRNRLITATILLALAVFVSLAIAGVPQLMNYQGRLLTDGGEPITATVPITFSLYSQAEGGTPIWTEPHEAVEVNSGIFSVTLGYAWPLPQDSVEDWGLESLWLGITVGEDDELIPRTRLTSVPYALTSASIGGYSQIDTRESHLGVRNGDGYASIQGSASDESFPAESFFDVFAYPDSGAVLKIGKKKPTGEKGELHFHAGTAPGVPNGYDDVVLRGMNVTAVEDTSSFEVYTGADSSGFRFYNTNGEYETDILEPIYHCFRMRAKYLSDYGDISEFGIRADETGASFMVTDNHGDTAISLDGGSGDIHAVGVIKSGNSLTLDGNNYRLISSNGQMYFGRDPAGGNFEDNVAGFGTQTPGARLEVKGFSGTSTPLFKINHQTSSPTDMLHTVFELHNNTYAYSPLLINGGGIIDQYDGSGLVNRFNPSGDSWFNSATGKLGIGTETPTSTLHNTGSVAVGYRSVNHADGLDENDCVVLASGTITLNLERPYNCPGRIYVIKNVGTGTVTISAPAGYYIDGATTYVLTTQYQTVTIMSDNTNWFVLGT